MKLKGGNKKGSGDGDDGKRKSPAFNSKVLKLAKQTLKPGGFFGIRVSENEVIQLDHDRLDKLIRVLERKEAVLPKDAHIPLEELLKEVDEAS